MSDLILTWSWEPDPIEYPKVEPTLKIFMGKYLHNAMRFDSEIVHCSSGKCIYLYQT